MGWFLRIVLLVVVGFGLIQLVPYGRDHSDPPSVQEPDWDSQRTRELAAAACFDCHSNLTEWPWYTNVAPFSWLVQRDVDEGREVLNFSEWHRPQQTDVREIVDVLREGEMPPLQYRLLHEQARLSELEKDELALGLSRTWDRSPPGNETP